MSNALQQSHDLRRWNEIATRTFGDIEVCARRDGFHGALTVHDWPALRVVTVDSAPARIQGGSVRQPGWFLLFNRAGSCRVQQAGQAAQLATGEMSLLRADDPYDIRFDEPNRMQVVALPTLDAPSALDDRVARRHGRDESAVVGALLDSTTTRPADAATPSRSAALRRAFADLLLLAAPMSGGTRPDPASCRRRALLGRLEMLVEQRLEDPELDVAAVAHALGISARYVQLLMAGQGTTLGTYLVEQRLRRAARRLRECDDRVADIALQVGFNDVSHFCRTFRRRFGCTARRWREG